MFFRSHFYIRLVKHWAPSLPSSFFHKEITTLFNETSAPVLNETLVLRSIEKSSNETNEVFAELTSTGDRKCSNTTSSWYKTCTVNSPLISITFPRLKFEHSTK